MGKSQLDLKGKISCEKILPYLALIKIPYFSFQGEVAYTNVYLIIDKELVLIDAGPWIKDYANMIAMAFKQLGLNFQDLSKIIYTHAHPDHIGGAIALNNELKISHAIYWKARKFVKQYGEYTKSVKSMLKAVFSKHLSSHPLEREIYFTFIDNFWKPTSGGIDIGHGLHEGESISTGRLKFKVLLTPGHSPFDISLWEEEKALLFSGDFLLKMNITLAGGIKGFGSDLVSYESSLKRIKPYLKKAKSVFPSHGPFITSCSNLADGPLRTIKLREDRILERLSTDRQSLIELVAALSRKNQNPLIFIRHLGVVLTHLEKLEMESKISCIQDGHNPIYELSR
ncbi:MAG: MBL fold metallo-hydrolase [Pseudomonadota bacterium]